MQVCHIAGRALNVSISCNGVFKLELQRVSMENLPNLTLYTQKRGDVYELVEAVVDMKEKTPVRNPDAVRKRKGDIGSAVGGQFGVYISAQPAAQPRVRTSTWRSRHGRTKLAKTEPRQVQYDAIRKKPPLGGQDPRHHEPIDMNKRCSGCGGTWFAGTVKKSHFGNYQKNCKQGITRCENTRTAQNGGDRVFLP
jgi:hypothetical protein